MNFRKFIPLIVLVPCLGLAPGCATTSEAGSEPATTAEATLGPPKAATKPSPHRTTPNFSSPPPSYDPLFGGSHDPLFGPDRLKVQALCCPEHGRPRNSFDPLLD